MRQTIFDELFVLLRLTREVLVVRSVTFSEVGTKVEGTLYCPSLGGLIPFTGTKIAHGRGQKLSSAYEWTALNESAWERAWC